MRVVESVKKVTVLDITPRRIKAVQAMRTNDLAANTGIQPHVAYISMATPPEMANEWLLWVHVAITNLVRFLLRTLHHASIRYLQDYLNEFCYRFNRRFWEAEIPNRLSRLCVAHNPVIVVEQ